MGLRKLLELQVRAAAQQGEEPGASGSGWAAAGTSSCLRGAGEGAHGAPRGRGAPRESAESAWSPPRLLWRSEPVAGSCPCGSRGWYPAGQAPRRPRAFLQPHRPSFPREPPTEPQAPEGPPAPSGTCRLSFWVTSRAHKSFMTPGRLPSAQV